MQRAVRRLVVLAMVLASQGAVSPAFAGNEECARSYETGQRLRKDVKLIDARRELLKCAQDSCPAVLRKDCTHWLGELNDAVPAIAVQAHGADGCDRPFAHVTIDGLEVARAAEGRPVELDPGPHTIRAIIDGAAAEQAVVMSEGERRRIIVLSTAAAGVTCGVREAAPRPVVARPAEPAHRGDRGEGERPMRPLVYVLGGIGLVSLGVGTGFGISAWSQKGTLDDCRGGCSDRDVDTMQRTFLVTDVALGVGVVALAAAAFVYLTR